ncbi:unnamed protein product [Cuscuta campestris]|uniref:Uncharacterized protein n=1 Tax=Cuscuta campestris TaxID=132261 RepID=A0A484L6B6_9ASTE|nr:unnamed protein product [Cuscuta campestris]
MELLVLLKGIIIPTQLIKFFVISGESEKEKIVAKRRSLVQMIGNERGMLDESVPGLANGGAFHRRFHRESPEDERDDFRRQIV